MPLPLIVGGISLLGGAFKGIGSYGSNKEQQSTLRANARIARLQGESEERAYQRNADIQTEVGRENLSTMRNTFANRGIDITSGSPLLVATSEYADQLADRNETFRQGEIARIKGENTARNLEYQADSLKKALPWSMLGIGLSTAGSAASSYMSAGGDFSFLSSSAESVSGTPGGYQMH